MRHVKGMLLHGPPGTGKTLVAKRLGELLNAHPPKIVNGPEILQRFVGQSEENMRDLFAPAEKEWKGKGEKSRLHVIVFDEIDAIMKARGREARRRRWCTTTSSISSSRNSTACRASTTSSSSASPTDGTS